jgi:DNA-binding transcriptional MocR family regulator
MAGWTPTLPPGAAPLYERLLDALRADIASGVLNDGDRLPPQRDLAHRLGLGLGTVTRAYVEAEKAGLVQGHVGRGSFVRSGTAASRTPAAASSGPINLAQNIAPQRAAADHLVEALAKLRRRPDLLDHLAYAPLAGLETQRRAGAAWLARSGKLEGVDWTRLICCAGAQQGLALALGALARPGDTVLCEASTYQGVKAIAEYGGLRLRGLAMDAEGVRPDALEAAARDGARVAALLPTLQNPTGRIMSLRRREEIVAVARKHDLWLVEDDIYAVYAGPNHPPPLAVLAPERVFHVSGVSKSLAPGLRAGYLVAPPGEHLDRVLRAARALTYAPPALGGLIATQWIEDGTADLIAAAGVAETTTRLAMALEILGSAAEPPASPAAPHLWLPMGELEAERLAGRALREGVEVTPPGAPVVTPGQETGVRICLGPATDLAELEKGLRVVAAALTGADERSRAVI